MENNRSETFSAINPSARVLWAKSGDGGGHGLLAHMLDVAATAEFLLQLEPETTTEWIATELGIPRPSTVRALAALVGLHDFGKSIPGFQNKWEQGRQRDRAAGLPFARDLGITDHGLASGKLLEKHLTECGLPRQWTSAVLQALSAHHGYNFTENEVGNISLPRSPEWSAARQHLFQAYWTALAPQLSPTVDEPSLAAVEWLAGLTSIADWIASNPEWFPLGERADSVQEHFVIASQLAGRACESIGWRQVQPLAPTDATTEQLLARILSCPEAKPRPLQAVGDRMLQDAAGPSLMLVEAPMGEGKTEVAFLAHLRLQATNGHRGLYIALPTQATGNAMFDRTLMFLQSFAKTMQLDMQLVHGGAQLSDKVQHLRGVWGEGGERQEGVHSSAWFSQRRRPLISHYGVGTVDQALLCALNVKHHFVRLWGLANRVVVIDEVHAYDTYTTRLIVTMLRWFKDLGCSVILMSATLPDKDRRSLLEAWGVRTQQLSEVSYPRLILADGSGVRAESFAARPTPAVHLRAIAEDLACIAETALSALGPEGCGAIIVNTVDRAQKLYSLLREQAGKGLEVLLFHARFPADQRSALEAAILSRFGAPAPGVTRPRRSLVVATQVLEQSLDVDFDFLITDLAPVDLILQRSGRLHRHERVRPHGHELPRLFVAGLQVDRMPELRQTKWEFVYAPYILLRTWALLSREEILQMPADIDRLMQAVYDNDLLPEDLAAEARAAIEGEAYGKYQAHLKHEAQMASNAAIDPRREPQAAYNNKPRGHAEGDDPFGIRNRTRLGEEAITLVPVHAVPGGWSIDAQNTPFDPDSPLNDAYAKRLFRRQLRLSRKDVVVFFAQVKAPRAFSEHPLLEHTRPLLLTDGVAYLSTLRLRLDAQLGLVYETIAASRPEEQHAARS